ncbi:MAG: efflux RND transporter permease subunit, partial [Acidobacteriota bacterium]
MWIVQLALRRPYTFVVMALAIILAGSVSIFRMPADIFPDINIPIVSVIWQFGGLTPDTMANLVTTRSERGMTTTVNDIEHIESQTMQGLGIIRIFFHPEAKIEAAVAQATSQTASLVGFLPDGARPPNLIRYNAASVPVLQIGLSSETLTEQEVSDISQNFVRTQLATIQGASIPSAYGGKSRNVMVDLNPQKLYSYNLSPADVSAALAAQNVTMPAGSAKIGDREYRVELNNSPNLIEQFNQLPIKTVKGSTIYVRDVAHVHDGFTIQQNIVRHDGTRGVLMSVIKNGGASTLDVVQRVKDVLPRIKTTLPPGIDIALLFDQSVFVRSAISGVVKEAAAAAVLTGVMILLFLGSWRSTLIVCVSIPLSILTSLAIL